MVKLWEKLKSVKASEGPKKDVAGLRQGVVKQREPRPRLRLACGSAQGLL